LCAPDTFGGGAGLLKIVAANPIAVLVARRLRGRPLPPTELR